MKKVKVKAWALVHVSDGSICQHGGCPGVRLRKREAEAWAVAERLKVVRVEITELERRAKKA